MRHISLLEPAKIPQDDEFQFRDRAKALVDKWSKMLHHENRDHGPVRSDIWFADGNIIVQAESTQFRVYKGTLCMSSEIFKTAIASMDENRTVDGCPLLYLSDLSVDITYLFRAIFDRWYGVSLCPYCLSDDHIQVIS